VQRNLRKVTVGNMLLKYMFTYVRSGGSRENVVALVDPARGRKSGGEKEADLGGGKDPRKRSSK